MRYFVLAPSGERYGPADIPTLNEWAATSRLLPSSRIQDEMSGAVIAASAVPGIVFPRAAPPPPSAGPLQPLSPGTPYQSPQPPTPHAPLSPGQSPYLRPGLHGDNGSKEMWAAFGMALAAPALGLLSMYGIVLAIGGIGAGWKSFQKGQRLGLLALGLNVIALPVAFYLRFVLRYQLLSRY